jgi:hypothetical protein
MLATSCTQSTTGTQATTKMQATTMTPTAADILTPITREFSRKFSKKIVRKATIVKKYEAKIAFFPDRYHSVR